MYFDKDNILEFGIVEGVTVYVDSVFIKRNTLLYRIGNILSEDSVYWMVVPDKNSWEAIYDSVYNYFNYSYIDKADSIQNYWANYSLIQDMVFNPKEQKIKEDSLMSTTYVTNGYSYNVYYRPYDEGGLLNNIKEDM